MQNCVETRKKSELFSDNIFQAYFLLHLSKF